MVLFEHRALIILYNFLRSIENDRIFLLPANICPLVITTFYKAKRNFEFVDISSNTLCMDEDLVIQKLCQHPGKYAGVVFVRTYGLMRSFESFFNRIQSVDKGIFIVDDRCPAIPEFTEDENTLADLVLYSTGYSKFVDIGWGGYAFLKENRVNYKKRRLPYDKRDLEKLIGEVNDSLKNHRFIVFNDSNWLGDTDFHESYGDYKKLVIKKMCEIKAAKAVINGIYRDNLPKKIQLGKEYQSWRFNILVDNKEGLLEKISKSGLFASSHYASLPGVFPGVPCDNALMLHARVVNLFNDFRFNPAKARQVSQIVRDHLRG